MLHRRIALPAATAAQTGGAVAGRLLGVRDSVDVTLFLRETPDGPSLDDTLAEQQRHPVQSRSYLTPEQYTALHGAAAEDITEVRRFAARNGLAVVRADPSTRQVTLRASAAKINAAFAVQLREFNHSGGVSFRSFEGTPAIESALAERVVGIAGLDTRPIAQPRIAGARRGPSVAPRAMDPTAIAAAYNWPKIDGTGLTIGIIELGGQVSDADVTAYAKRLGIPKPVVKHVSVDGAKPTPDPNGADIEVALDVDVIAAMAPGATIVIYDAPNTDQGFIDAIHAAANDTVNNPTTVSISWGAPESQWTVATMQAMDAAFAAGAAKGVTYTSATGDNGSTDNVNDGLQHADHPSSSPHVVATSGTTLTTSGTTIVSETVWGGSFLGGATGGGMSDQFSTPTYQTANGVDPVSANPGGRHGRGVGDVAGNADPATGWNVRSGGQDTSVGGTSAVAPMWAALLALVSKQAGRKLGWVNPTLYAIDKSAYNDITSGSNGAYSAAPGWDPPTGWGSPNAAQLAVEVASHVPQLCAPLRVNPPAVGSPAQPAGRSLG